MGVNFTDKEQNKIALMKVETYDSIAEYMTGRFADVSAEEAAESFANSVDLGFIRDITIDTYNGATQTFQKRQLNDSNILEAIFTDLHEDDFYNFVAEYEDDISDWTNADYIREYTEVYNVFIIDGCIYVDVD